MEIKHKNYNNINEKNLKLNTNKETKYPINLKQ